MTKKEKMIYREGIKCGIWWFAVWKNGKLMVGVQEKPIEEIYRNIDAGKYDEK